MLLTRRWLTLTAAVLVFAAVCVRLGLWQWHRHEERRAANALVAANYARPPVPVDDLLSTTQPPQSASVWRAVRAHGTYEPARSILVRNRTHDGATGVHVVVPLRTERGALLLVDRGFVPRTGGASDVVAVPAPPAGVVEVTGHVHQVERDGPTRVTIGAQPSVPRLDVAAIARWLGEPVYGAAIDLASERPAPTTAPVPPEPPVFGSWRNLPYAVQWWLFACLAIVGWLLLLRRDLHDERQAAGAPPNREQLQLPARRG